MCFQVRRLVQDTVGTTWPRVLESSTAYCFFLQSCYCTGFCFDILIRLTGLTGQTFANITESQLLRKLKQGDLEKE